MQHICYSMSIMLTDPIPLNEQLVTLIANRVADALREDLEAITAQVTRKPAQSEQLTVDQVARQLGVARSTVYAHWREWGGYRLGSGDRARIRFDSAALPSGATTGTTAGQSQVRQPSEGPRRRRNRRGLLANTPRLAPRFDPLG